MGKRRHRIKADPSKLACPGGYRQPDYYRDKQQNCIDCGVKFVFTAEEQQVWYEKYGIPHYALKCRCGECRERHKTRQEMKTAYDNAVQTAKTHSEDALANFELGKSTFLQIEAGHGGHLESAIGALKRALELNPRMAECHYWLGRCYERLRNGQKARHSFTEFIQKAEDRKKSVSKTLVKDAQSRMQQLCD